jgi:hypothetical protein
MIKIPQLKAVIAAFALSPLISNVHIFTKYNDSAGFRIFISIIFWGSLLFRKELITYPLVALPSGVGQAHGTVRIKIW